MYPPPEAILKTINVARLPSFPPALARLMEVLDNPAASWHDLAEVIGADTGLAARVLAAAGAVAHGRNQRVVELEAALMLLGRDAVHAIAISASIYHVFRHFPHDAAFDLARYWRHCLRCASICRGLAKTTGYRSPEEAYLAGLTHDVGQLLLASGLAESYTRLHASVADERALSGVELEHLGTTHCDIGAWVVERWRLDSFMADAARYHHASAQRIAAAHPLIRIVALAESLSATGPTDAVADDAMLLLGLATAELEAVVAEANGNVERIARSFGLSREAAAPLPAPQPRAGVDAEIARRVGDATLLACARSSLAAGTRRDERLAAARQSLTLLFGVRKAVFLLADDRGEVLVGERLAGDRGLVGEIIVPLRAPCTLTECLRQDVLLVGGAAAAGVEALPVADAGLLHALEEAAFIAVPLTDGGRARGVMILGGSFGEVNALQTSAPLLKSFAGCIAREVVKATATETTPGRVVAHEANNALAIIRNYAFSLRQRLARAEPDVVADLDLVGAEINRVAALVRGFVEPGPGAESGPTELNDLVRVLLPLWERSLFAGTGIRVETRLDPAALMAAADRNRLTQVLLNLAKNAAEAMPDGGVFSLATYGGINRDGAPCVAIEVADSGPGVQPELLDRLFAPVPTGKNGDHSGLGLAICRDLVRQLDGTISCRSSRKAGACFEILLPRA